MYEERLQTLTKLFKDLTTKLEAETSSDNNTEKVKEYQHQLAQIKTEINRIEKSRAYKRR